MDNGILRHDVNLGQQSFLSTDFKDKNHMTHLRKKPPGITTESLVYSLVQMSHCSRTYQGKIFLDRGGKQKICLISELYTGCCMVSAQ